MVRPHVGEELAGDSLGKDQGKEDADGGQGGGSNGPGHLGCALDRRVRRGHPLRPQTVDVFNDHDAVVHQHADAERQPR